MVGADRPPKQAMPAVRQEDLGVSFGRSLCRYTQLHAVKKWRCMFRRGRVDVSCSLVGADRPPKEAMPVAIACLEQEDLDFDIFRWER